MKSFVRFVLLALVLLVVALVSALTAMRFAIHGQEVAVPDLAGKTPAEARRIAEPAGFDVNVERQYYSASVAEGRVLSQLPLAGTKVRRGWQIRVALSLGPQRVAIPNVLGQSERAAEMNIRRRGLEVASTAQVAIAGGSPDQVVAQSPPPNASGVSAPKISLLTSQSAPPQAFVMPSFVGQALGGVSLVLQDAGLRLGRVTIQPPPNVSPAGGGQMPSGVASTGQPSALPIPAPPQATPASVIVSQNPSAGTKVLAGSTVDFEVR